MLLIRSIFVTTTDMFKKLFNITRKFVQLSCGTSFGKKYDSAIIYYHDNFLVFLMTINIGSYFNCSHDDTIFNQLQLAWNHD